MNGGAVVPENTPVRAWRYWQLSPRRYLRSVAQRHVEWRPGQVMHAVCIGGGHPSPSVGCWCGVSGARDMDALRDHGLCVLPGPLLVGEVDLWGRLIEESYGWRAEHARPASIGVVAETVPGLRGPNAMDGLRGPNAMDGLHGVNAPDGPDAMVDQLVRELGAYGVPVHLVPLDEAVAGTTAQMLAFQVMSSKASWGDGG